MTGYKSIVAGFGIIVEGIEDSDRIGYCIECQGKRDKLRYAKLRESSKGTYFISNFGGCRVRQYLNDFMTI